MPESDRLIGVVLDEASLVRPTPEMEQERRVAIFDILEGNHFALAPRPDRHHGLKPPAGPYCLALSVRDRRLVFGVATDAGEPAGEFHLSVTPFAQVVKDYFQICESYFEAVRRLPPARIEVVDMGRRGIHDEGARLLIESLEGKVEIDMPTARRLFTLICVLHEVE